MCDMLKIDWAPARLCMLPRATSTAIIKYTSFSNFEGIIQEIFTFFLNITLSGKSIIKSYSHWIYPSAKNTTFLQS